MTGAAAMLGGALPLGADPWLAFLYSLGAHGIMTLNDFKSIKGDSQMGIDRCRCCSAPRARPGRPASIMAAPQVVVIGLLLAWGAADRRGDRGRAAGSGSSR